MIHPRFLMIFCCWLLTANAAAGAQEAAPTAAPNTSAGSSAFCLYELPADIDGKRRWVNLGIVQYVEFNRNELRIYYGGGNLGSGHEARIPVTNSAQVDEALNKIRQVAANCR